MSIRVESKAWIGTAIGLLALIAAWPAGLAAQVDERGAMTPATSEPELNTTQQAHMKLLSGQRQQKQARKYDQKAAEASSDSKRTKLREKAKKAFEGAIRDYVTALRMDNTLHEAYVGLGELFAKAGQHDQSLESFNQALGLDPENAEAMIGRARVQLATFKVEDAKMSYGELKKVDSENAGVLLAEMGTWLEDQKARLGPEAAAETVQAMTDLESWIAENAGS